MSTPGEILGNVTERASSAVGRRISRRGFISKATLAAAAAAAAPFAFAMRPIAANAITCANCSPGDLCCAVNSVFCCTLTGNNSCPSGSVKSGWWRCSYDACQPTSPYRYFIDCNPTGSCTPQCANNLCSRRKTCVNPRTYTQCGPSSLGPVKCRIVRCQNPGTLWPVDCDTIPINSSNTCSETAGCLP